MEGAGCCRQKERQMSKWGSFPRWAGEKLPEFRAGKNAGAHMSALRIYLAFALVADYTTRNAAISWTKLQALTGLSRPMVTKGITTAKEMGLIDIDTSGHTHSYALLSKEDDVAFTQVPMTLKDTLSQLPTRGFHALDALKVYMTLLTVRRRHSDISAISHRKIVTWTGIQPRRIRAAVDVLINHNLVHVMSAESDGIGHPHNEYRLLGFSQGSAVASTTAIVPPSPPVIVAPSPSFLSVPIPGEDIPF
jgi:hypothetical protein